MPFCHIQVGELGGMDAPSRSKGAVSSSTNRPPKLMKIFNHSSLVGTNVSNKPGGSIVIDQDALTTWSIDAMRVIRDQLYRASSGAMELPFWEHWPRERSHFRNQEVEDGNIGTAESQIDLPLWAEEVQSPSSTNTSVEVDDNTDGRNNNKPTVIVADLKQMSNEVGALLESVELHLEQQRLRRLNRLRPPSRLRRNW